MKNKIQQAFQEIHADESLKENTKEKINVALFKRNNHFSFKKLVPIASCFVALILGVSAYLSYVTPVAAIGLDINPSIELEINMYEKVINVNGYNNDGNALVQTLDIKNMNYFEAIDCILNTETIQNCLKEDQSLEISVTGRSKQRNEHIRQGLLNHHSLNSDEITCSNNHEEIDQAKSFGLSFGKYKAYLELKESNSQIPLDEIKNLSMKEIRKLINENNHQSEESCKGNGHCHGKKSNE